MFSFHPRALAFSPREHISLPEKMHFYICEICMNSLLETMLKIYFEYILYVFLNICTEYRFLCLRIYWYLLQNIEALCLAGGRSTGVRVTSACACFRCSRTHLSALEYRSFCLRKHMSLLEHCVSAGGQSTGVRATSARACSLSLLPSRSQRSPSSTNISYIRHLGPYSGLGFQVHPRARAPCHCTPLAPRGLNRPRTFHV